MARATAAPLLVEVVVPEVELAVLPPEVLDGDEAPWEAPAPIWVAFLDPHLKDKQKF